MVIRYLSIALLVLIFSGCVTPFPGSKRYSPANAEEQKIFSQAHKDIFPDDVRANITQYDSSVMLWSSTITDIQKSQSDNQEIVKIEFKHHYWDFIEDYSVQKEIAFLSPRGEGVFKAIIPSEALKKDVSIGDMAIVYVVPVKIDSNGDILVVLRGMRTLKSDLYATDIWDYGRVYLLKHDMSDFKSLRLPK